MPACTGDYRSGGQGAAHVQTDAAEVIPDGQEVQGRGQVGRVSRNEQKMMVNDVA